MKILQNVRFDPNLASPGLGWDWKSLNTCLLLKESRLQGSLSQSCLRIEDDNSIGIHKPLNSCNNMYQEGHMGQHGGNLVLVLGGEFTKIPSR